MHEVPYLENSSLWKKVKTHLRLKPCSENLDNLVWSFYAT